MTYDLCDPIVVGFNTIENLKEMGVYIMKSPDTIGQKSSTKHHTYKWIWNKFGHVARKP